MNIIIYYLLLIPVVFSSECEVTAIKTFWQCVNYCSNKYNGQKMYYNRWKGICEVQKKCPSGTLLRYYENVCVNGSSTTIIDNIIEVLDYEQFEVVYKVCEHGSVSQASYICFPGWKSSYHRENIGWRTYKQYYCDLQMKDGEIYPMSHGQYFFNQLHYITQNQALNTAYSSQTLFTINFILFTITMILFTLVHIYLCFYAIYKKYRTKQQPQQEMQFNYPYPPVSDSINLDDINNNHISQTKVQCTLTPTKQEPEQPEQHTQHKQYQSILQTRKQQAMGSLNKWKTHLQNYVFTKYNQSNSQQTKPHHKQSKSQSTNHQRQKQNTNPDTVNDDSYHVPKKSHKNIKNSLQENSNTILSKSVRVNKQVNKDKQVSKGMHRSERDHKKKSKEKRKGTHSKDKSKQTHSKGKSNKNGSKEQHR